MSDESQSDETIEELFSTIPADDEAAEDEAEDEAADDELLGGGVSAEDAALF